MTTAAPESETRKESSSGVRRALQGTSAAPHRQRAEHRHQKFRAVVHEDSYYRVASNVLRASQGVEGDDLLLQLT